MGGEVRGQELAVYETLSLENGSESCSPADLTNVQTMLRIADVVLFGSQLE